MSTVRLLKDRRGGVAPMFALILVPMIAAIGAAVDYSMAAKTRSQLLAAADAASIGSVAKTSAALLAASTMSSDGPIPAGASDASKIFNAQLGTQAGYTLGAVTATVTKTGTTVTSTVAFTAQVPAHFMACSATRRCRSAAPRRRRTACRSSSISICCSTTRPRWASRRLPPT